MSVINIFSGSFCVEEEVAQETATRLGYALIRDEDIIGRAARKEGSSSEALRRAMFGRPSVFNKFSHDRERAVAALRLGVAEILSGDDLVIVGFASQLVPRRISHCLDVCLIAGTPRRAARAAREMGLNQKDALVRIHRDDEAAFRWVDYLRSREPWDPLNYDLRLATDKLQIAQVVEMIHKNATSQLLASTGDSRRAAADFLLAAGIEARLSARGHTRPDIEVAVEGDRITILVNKKVLMLGRLSEELEELARSVEGVKQVAVEPGPDYYQADVYRRADFQLPSKVLLVDDEREFVQTLSERLLLRDIGSAVVYDGEQALKAVAEEGPEVMVLDLKMPGLDGMEVLKRIKADHPEVEVIILTGHGSERDRETCMSLGAFDYLEKPVDINLLSEVMQRAQDKVRLR